MKPTHIVLTYPSQDIEILFRAIDGMMIGERHKVTVIWGVNPNAGSSDPGRKQSRVFLESDTPMLVGKDAFSWNHYGSRYLRDVVAKLDADENGLGKVVIEERSQEGLILMPPDSVDMRTNGGGIRAIGKKFD